MSPIKALVAQGSRSFPFDYYVRSVTTSVLSLVIVGATIYAVLTEVHPNELLVGWTGIVVGVYFGYHITTNGSEVSKSTQQQVMDEQVLPPPQ